MKHFLFFILLLTSACSFIAFSQEAIMTKAGSWGSGQYRSAVEINGNYYVRMYGSKIDVIDPNLLGAASLIKQYQFEDDKPIFEIANFKDHLVIAGSEEFSIYQIKSNYELELKYTLAKSYKSLFISDKLFYLDTSGNVSIISESEGEFELENNINVAGSEQSNYRQIFVDDNVLYLLQRTLSLGVWKTALDTFAIDTGVLITSSHIDGLESYYYANYVGNGVLALSGEFSLQLVGYQDNSLTLFDSYSSNGYLKATFSSGKIYAMSAPVQPSPNRNGSIVSFSINESNKLVHQANKSIRWAILPIFFISSKFNIIFIYNGR